MKKKTTENKNVQKSQSGITLIALVVTIVVLLILAGVSLNLVLGNNGLIAKAKEARDKYAQAAANELTDVNSVADWIDEQINGSGNGDGTGNPPTELPKTEETIPYLPTEDFTQVAGTDLSNGLVIEDKEHNQYVWIEVPRTTTVYPTVGTSLNVEELTDTDYTNIEKDLHTYTNTYRNGTSYKDEYYSDELTGLTSSEYTALKQKMLKSVYKNGGFWIGRYEAGIEVNRTHNTTIDTNLKPLSQENKYPLTCMSCSQAQTLASRVLGTNENYTSSLMFGVQWDLVMKYLETKGITQAELKSDSINWGNYSNNLWNITNTKAQYSENNGTNWNNTPKQKTESSSILLTTGASDTFRKMNIYDLAGNVTEFTLEYTSNTFMPCTLRGGNFGYSDSHAYASKATDYHAGTWNDTTGMRVTLY